MSEDIGITKSLTSKPAEEIPYLQACLYEGLRCYPAVGISLLQVALAGGFDIGGRHILEGTIVGINP